MIRHGDARGALLYSKQPSTAVLLYHYHMANVAVAEWSKFVQRCVDDLMWLCKYMAWELELQIGKPHLAKSSDVVSQHLYSCE
jgi:hypothetical protein